MRGEREMKRILLVLLVMALFVSTLAGCGTRTTTAVQDGKVKYGTTYPLSTNTTLSVWANEVINPVYKSYTEQPFYVNLMKRTGVKLDYKFPRGDQHREAFNLLIASNQLPDIIQYDWLALPGGPEKYLKEGYIIPLNDLIDKYAPNLKKYLANHPDVDKMVKTDKGVYYAFPFLRGDEWLNVYSGPVVRKDWLDKLGLAVPQTINEWEVALKAFKDKMGIKAPLTFVCDYTFETGFLSGAYGVELAYYLEDGKIKYGPQEAGWKDFISLLSRWYKEGLIDADIATIDSKIMTTRMSSGQSGATLGSGGYLGMWLPPLMQKDEKANLVAAPFPTLKKGETPKFGQYGNLYLGIASSAITKECKDVELAVKFLDYRFSDEGIMFCNFGEEGVSYNMVNGYPKFSDEIMNAKDFMSEATKYINYNSSVNDKRMYEQRLKYPQQKEAIGIWAKTDAKKYYLPPITASSEESSEVAKLTSDIDTYVKEMMLKFVLGQESLDNYDAYLANLKKIGVDKLITFKEQAFERYNKR